MEMLISIMAHDAQILHCIVKTMAHLIFQVKTILQRFLGFLSPLEVQNILEYTRQMPSSQKFVAHFTNLLNCSITELEELINRPGDEEDHVELLNIVLWQQKHGKINPNYRINYYFEDLHNQVTIHREMVANGYENIEQFPFTLFDSTLTSYAHEIDKYINFYQFQNYKNDEDYFGYLINILNVIGPRILNHRKLESIKKFVDYIIENIDIDVRLDWLEPGPFSILVYDLRLSPQKTWPVYCHSVQNGCRSIDDFVAVLLGFKIYGGDRVREVWKHFDVYGGMELIECAYRGCS